MSSVHQCSFIFYVPSVFQLDMILLFSYLLLFYPGIIFFGDSFDSN